MKLILRFHSVKNFRVFLGCYVYFYVDYISYILNATNVGLIHVLVVTGYCYVIVLYNASHATATISLSTVFLT
jgi:hypothetical protein